MKPEDIIVIVGPTASGKTSLAVNVAKKINAEIISADSMQIYQELNVGTAKVTEEEAQGIKHHLINICSINEYFSVSDYKKLCYEKIKEILSRGKKVIICGGTGLYINAVINDMNFEEEETDFAYREYLEKLAQEHSNEYVHDMLKKVDPHSAEVIHPNNLKRVIRALEIAKNSNKTKSEHMEKEKIRIQNKNSIYQFTVFYIDFDRNVLYDRINQRVDIMLNQGILEEAKKLYESHLDKNSTCMQAIGYKEFFPYFENKISLEEAVEKLKQDTRRYAKRQETWFKNQLDLIYLDGKKGTQELTNDIIRYMN